MVICFVGGGGNIVIAMFPDMKPNPGLAAADSVLDLSHRPNRTLFINATGLHIGMRFITYPYSTERGRVFCNDNSREL